MHVNYLRAGLSVVMPATFDTDDAICCGILKIFGLIFGVSQSAKKLRWGPGSFGGGLNSASMEWWGRLCFYRTTERGGSINPQHTR